MYDLDELNRIVKALPIRKIDIAIYLKMSRQILWEKLEGSISFKQKEVTKIYELKEKYNIKL